ncbi:PREDICTED: gem-associated protein 8-like [Polistes dominula]|uniref:Gem-associated protein 8-like n=1 Tax=Polistes dominula TaxID=743375 RepID=A0ABM1IX48_POLDO|nr:PREDICTED: gem-associated protein 8-like [Polistes dominula]
MEFLSRRRNRNRRKKRNLKRRQRECMKFGVKSVKSQRLLKECVNVNFSKEEVIIGNTMQADAFWKNYVAAQDWQKKHSVTWWRSRCLALENENEILRNKIRSLIGSNNKQSNNKQTVSKQQQQQQNTYKQNPNFREDYNENGYQNEEDLEFHVDEDMKTFLEQSLRHQMELKQKRDQELTDINLENLAFIESGLFCKQARNENAKLLYGDAGPTIMAMETALMATIERHKDKSKPQYWPNIPLRP